jgi:hypothetical protein
LVPAEGGGRRAPDWKKDREVFEEIVAAQKGSPFMTREQTVRVRGAKGAAVAFSAGEKYGLKIAAGETASEWADGSPITRAEFETVLAPHGPFEIVEDNSPSGAASAAARDASDRAED